MKPFILTAATAVVSLVVFLSQHTAVGQPQQPCNTISPADPVTYSEHMHNVLRQLVRQTPGSSKNIFQAYYPNRKPGSVTGTATCYTNADPEACRACLQDVKVQLGRCVRSTSGGYFEDRCNMQFWEIGSIV